MITEVKRTDGGIAGGHTMSDKETIEALQKELAKVKEERDGFRRACQALLAEKHPFDPVKFEQDIREIQAHGIPLSKAIEEIEARLGAA